MRTPAPNPQPLAPNLQDNNEEERPRADRRLDRKALRRAHFLCPLDLEITDNEPARHPRPVQPRGHLAGSVGVGVEEVGGDGGGGDHDAEDVEAPAEGGDGVVEVVAHGFAEDGGDDGSEVEVAGEVGVMMRLAISG